jgi:hypothetical protein
MVVYRDLLFLLVVYDSDFLGIRKEKAYDLAEEDTLCKLSEQETF